MPKKNTTESVSVSLESRLISVIDSICERKDFSRSNFIKRAVKKYIGQIQSEDPKFWDRLYYDNENDDS